MAALLCPCASGPSGSVLGGQRQAQSPQQRQERSRNRLDRSTPERRAKVAEFSRMMQQRMAERGVGGGNRSGGFGGRPFNRT